MQYNYNFKDITVILFGSAIQVLEFSFDESGDVAFSKTNSTYATGYSRSSIECEGSLKVEAPVADSLTKAALDKGITGILRLPPTTASFIAQDETDNLITTFELQNLMFTKAGRSGSPSADGISVTLPFKFSRLIQTPA